MARTARKVEIDLARIEQMLEARGLSAFTASKRAGNPDLIRDVQRGKSNMMRIDSLDRLAEVLDCDPEFFTREQDTPRREQENVDPDASRATFALSYDEVTAIGFLRAAGSDEERAQMLAVWRAMLAKPQSNHDTPGVDSRGRSVGNH